MDNFKEEVIAKKGGQGMRSLMILLTYVFLAVFAVIGFLGLSPIMNGQFSLLNFVAAIGGFGGAWMLWRNKDNYSTEYEYTFTSGEMDFAKVLAGKRRRHMLTFKLSDSEAMGFADSPEYGRYSSMPNIKKVDLTLNADTKKQFIYFVKEGNKYLMLLECGDAMWDMMVNSVPKFRSPGARYR